MKTKILGPGDKLEYVTHKIHGAHPAGSTCLASRNSAGKLVLEFTDGDTVILDGHYYAAGIEDAMPADAVLFLAS